MRRATDLRPRGIRWRDDVGFELRCADCAVAGAPAYWPLDLEFWAPELSMHRCRACWRRRLASYKKKQRDLDPETHRERVRRARRDPGIKYAQRLKEQAKWEAIKADPVKLDAVRARNRISNARYRAKKRAEQAAA